MNFIFVIICDFNYGMYVVWHDHPLAQLYLGMIIGDVYHFIFDDYAAFGQNHLSIYNFSEDTCSVFCTYGNKIGHQPMNNPNNAIG